MYAKLAPFVLMLGCVPKPQEVIPPPLPGNGTTTTAGFVGIAGPEDENGTPHTDLKLGLYDARGTEVGRTTLQTVAGSCSVVAEDKEALSMLSCWWAGGGQDFRVVQTGNILMVERRETDEGLPKPTPWDFVTSFGVPGDATLGAHAYVVEGGAPDYAAMVADPDRTEADRALDAGRHPAALLEFAGIEPGMRVAELGAGGGYTTELLARAVGPTGKVYGQNSQLILDRFAAQPWADRLARPINSNVVSVIAPFDAPFTSDVEQGLDVVVLNLFYHDAVWMKADLKAMNQAIFDQLAPGGRYIVIDHSAAAGHGIADTETLHRIEESVVVDEVKAAGFELEGTSDVWKVAEDTRDWSTSPRTAGEKRGTSDRFALKFKKPEAP